MPENDQPPPVRLIIYPSDIANITGCSLEAAEARYRRLKRKLKKKKGAKLPIRNIAFIQIYANRK